MSFLKAVVLTLLVTSVSLHAASGSPVGLLNSFEGQVWINGKEVQPVDAAQNTLKVGGVIRTGHGMVELLLTPGTFLRLGERSGLALEASGPPEVRARVENGEVLLEVLDMQVPIVLEQNGATAAVRKPGLYGFDQEHASMTVYVGEAVLSKDGVMINVGEGFSVSARHLRPFPSSPAVANSLFSWSRLRSEQLSDESAAVAQTPGWHGTDWYRVPWSNSYTFLSASGAVTGAFGWPYYSPGYLPNSAPTHPSGDTYLYSPPVISLPSSGRAGTPAVTSPGPDATPYTVPLTLPGLPQFPK